MSIDTLLVKLRQRSAIEEEKWQGDITPTFAHHPTPPNDEQLSDYLQMYLLSALNESLSRS